jgi:hypothetical protein
VNALGTERAGTLAEGRRWPDNEGVTLLSLSPRWKGLGAAFVTAYWAGLALSTQYDVELLFRLGDFAPYLVGVVLAFAGGILVGQWIVLVTAFAAPLVLAGLQLAGYRASYHEATAPLSGWVWWFVLCAVPLAFGVLVRRRGLSPYPRPSTE